MKLEIKHIAPYLPYQLKIRSFRYNDDLFIEDIFISGEFLDYLFENSHSRINSPNYYKPILRPLFNLTKEIEVNGEKFIPIVMIKAFGELKKGLTENDSNMLGYFIQTWGDKSKIPYWAMELLFEWNFDIFNLIENDLAIDINKI